MEDGMPKMKYSKEGLQLTERFEGCRRSAYWDNLGKVWTIGYGHTRGVKQGDYCSMDQANAWLMEDVAFAEKNVNEECTEAIESGFIDQHMFDALVDFDFNLGDGAFDKSTLLKLVQHHDKEHAALEFEKWKYAGGQVVAGLLRRRLAEKAEFLGIEEKEG
jgi:lysozyme